jgi:hypothetical protein
VSSDGEPHAACVNECNGDITPTINLTADDLVFMRKSFVYEWVFSMQRLRVPAFVIAVVLLTDIGIAAIRPHFSLDYSGWHATHIVLVQTLARDGTFEVVESWKGDLPVGERIAIPELRSESNDAPISSYPIEWPFLDKVSEQIPRQPIGSRLILFLTSEAPGRKRTAQRVWKSSDFMNSMKASVLWMDNGKVYRFTQPLNPGPSVLAPSEYSEADVRARVAEISAIHQGITEALAAKNGAERAERLKPFVHSTLFPARQFALEQLGKCGTSAVPTISGMLDDPAFAGEASELVKALVAAGGNTVGEQLKNRLGQDLAFWRSVGPSLSHDWWNQVTTHASLPERYSQTYELIIALERVRFVPALDTAVQLRDFWRSLPQLTDHTQLPEECDKLIGKLQNN